MNKRRIIVTAFGFILGSTVFISCGSHGSAFTPVSPPPGKGVVYIYRKPSFVGWAASGTLRTNGVSITTISNGGYFPYVGPPGDTLFATKIDWSRKQTVRVEQGKSKYLKIEFGGLNMARILTLTEVPASLGASEITECKLLEPITR